MSTHHLSYPDLETIKHLYNAHLGERCALLCNGESLNSFPLAYPFDTIGINRSWMINPLSRYHFVLSLDQLTAMAKEKTHDLYYPAECVFIGINRDQKEANQTKNELRKKLNTRHSMLIDGWTQNDCVTKTIGFAIDLESQRLWMPNTPYLALQFILWMGYKHVDIWGLDLEGPKFWDPDWRMTEGHAKQQDEFFQYAARVLVNDGVTVINRNPKSQCTAFYKERW